MQFDIHETSSRLAKQKLIMGHEPFCFDTRKGDNQVY